MKKRTILLIGKYKKVESDISRYKRNFFVLAIDNLLGIKSLKKHDLEKIEAIAFKGHTNFNFPIMKSFTKAGSEITLRADYAKVNSDSSELHLFKKVKFNQSKNLKNKAVLITSEYMLALPNQDIIKTDKNVAIKQGNSLLLGEGLFGNIVEQQFTLLSNVNGTFKNKK